MPLKPPLSVNRTAGANGLPPETLRARQGLGNSGQITENLGSQSQPSPPAVLTATRRWSHAGRVSSQIQVASAPTLLWRACVGAHPMVLKGSAGLLQARPG